MIEIQRLKQVLREIEFTADLPEPAIDECAAASKLSDFVAGATIFDEGTVNEFLYVVVDGRVGLDIFVPGRGRVRVLSVGPGEMLAWSALLGNGTMTVSAIALEDTQVLGMPGAQLLDICGKNHEAGFHIMRRMASALAQRLVATRLQLLDLFAEPAGAGPVRS